MKEKIMFTISYDAEISDMQAGYALFQRTCKSVSRSLKWIKAIAVLWLLAIACNAIMSHSIHPAMIGLGAGALYILFGLSWQTKRQIKKTFLNMAAPSATLPITMTCDEQHISFTLRDKSEAKFFWTGVLGSAEDKQAFIIIPVKRTFYYIPKRVLTEEALSLLRSVAPGAPSSC
jgi:hypothetical protein